MREPHTAPTPTNDTPTQPVIDVVAVAKRIMDRMDAQRAEITRLLRAVQAVLD